MVRINEMTPVSQNASVSSKILKKLETTEIFDFQCSDSTGSLEVCQNEDELKNLLTKYGLDAEALIHGAITSANVKHCETGEAVLILKSAESGYQLELPLDEKYNPEAISIGAGEGRVQFKGIRGTLRIIAAKTDYTKIFQFKNSDVEIYCLDDHVDTIASCDKNTRLKIHTNEYCDKYYDLTDSEPGTWERGSSYETTPLRPGVTTINTKPWYKFW